MSEADQEVYSLQKVEGVLVPSLDDKTQRIIATSNWPWTSGLRTLLSGCLVVHYFIDTAHMYCMLMYSIGRPVPSLRQPPLPQMETHVDRSLLTSVSSSKGDRNKLMA